MGRKLLEVKTLHGLTIDELIALEETYEKKSLKTLLRTVIMRYKGIHTEEIQNILGRSRPSITGYINKWNEHGIDALVNIIEESFQNYKNINLTRDIYATKYKDSLDNFMKTIREHDYVISIVSSAYIKSLNCMYEIENLMKDREYEDKLFFIVVGKEDIGYYNKANIYLDFEAGIYDLNKRLQYIAYWRSKQEELHKNIKEATLPPESMQNISKDMRKLDAIIPSMDDFISLLSDKVGRTFDEMYKSNFQEILSTLDI